MGFEKMKEFTHQLENIFEQIRQYKLEVTPELINVILESIDIIRQLKESIVEETLDDFNITPHIEKLNQLENSPSKVSEDISEIKEETFVLDDTQKKILLEGLDLGHNILKIEISIFKDSLMKNVRAILIHKVISENGEIIATFPSVEVIENEDLFQGNLSKQWLKYIASNMEKVKFISKVPLIYKLSNKMKAVSAFFVFYPFFFVCKCSKAFSIT